MARENRAIIRLVAVTLLLLVCTIRCEARSMRRLQTKSNPLLNALFKLNFIRTVEPSHLPPPTGKADAASLAAADGGDGSNTPFCVNPPDPPSTTTPPFSSTPSTPSIPDQPPPLPPITPVPPSFEPSPPDSSTPGGQGGQEGPPATTTPNPPQNSPNTPFGMVPPSPIVVVPSPPGSGSGSGSGGTFLPPIVYPPPLAPPLLPGAGQPLWCVAKPTVPDPIIQEAMDYACGSGAECGSIQPSGACYQPDTVLAHASFAFNSYWQQTRAAGGTCDFGGTATIVTRDPSYEKCKFNLL
ncbi:leucine-rich repeat extensin-like protein 5 isoform X2 [Phragmites australis]|nr:leucine-rich repeat extensin-like protein 5 isoform X2 [Phragmites australis]